MADEKERIVDDYDEEDEELEQSHKKATEHKENEHKEHEHKKTHDKNEGHHKDHKTHKVVKEEKDSPFNVMFIVSIVILVIGIALVFYGLSLVDKASNNPKEEVTAAGEDLFIFLTSEGCDDVCADAEPLAKEAASGLNLNYRKIEYFQPVPFPGYFTVKDGKMSGLLGIQDKSVFAQEMCDAGAENVCAKVEELSKESAKLAAAAAAEEAKAAAVSCDTTTKYDTVKFETWVVSRCPFGTQTLNGLVGAVELLDGEKGITITPRYLVSEQPDGTLTAMHGEAEYLENVRHVCLREEQSDVFWDYVKCYVETGKTTECEVIAKVDSDKLEDCSENRGTSLMKKELEFQKAAGNPSGSPTNMINGKNINEFLFGGRSAEGLKSTICCSLKDKPEACNTELSTAQPPRGFGVIDNAAAAAGSTEQLNCG